MSTTTADVSLADLHQRVGSGDYDRWRQHIAAAAACSFPIRLRGQLHTVVTETGRIVRTVETADMPDRVLYVPCGNRRATVCPACSEVYRADTYQLVKAGLAGGKGVPLTVGRHPCVFLTLTAPGFGPVHAHHRDGRPCHPRRTPDTCEHGVTVDCRDRHTEDGPLSGRPFCLDCYDHEHQVVWNGYAGELWRRTRNTAVRQLRRLEQRHGCGLRLSYAKVAEFQRRGVVHIHAMVRLDGYDPDDPTAVIEPTTSISSAHLAELMRTAVHTTVFSTPAHPDRPEGWPIAWGEQVEPRPIQLTVRDVDDSGEITTGAVAAYLAKYATKATETAGHVSFRLNGRTVRDYADPATHPGRLIAACWRLGRQPADLTAAEVDEWAAGYGRLRRWAHMLGFGGHFSTKSRRYSTTLGALRQARRDWRRARLHDAGPDAELPEVDEDETTLVIGTLAFAGIGWHTTADALLANTAAAKAREHRLTAREELTTHYPDH